MFELDFFSYGFIQRALLSGLIVAITCPLIGIFLVLKRQSLFGDAISHMAFGGIAIGTYLNIYPIWTAMGFSIAAALVDTDVHARGQRPAVVFVADVEESVEGAGAAVEIPQNETTAVLILARAPQFEA